jgi:hypothetical protein
MRFKLVTASLSIALALSVGVNIYQYTKSTSAIGAPGSASPSENNDRMDERYIDRAFEYWSRKTNATIAQVRADRTGKVMYFPTEACVSLELEPGGVGGVPIYCFDLQNDRLTRRYDDVE